MGLFSSIAGAIGSVCSAVCSCIGSICSGIGSIGSALGGAVSSFVTSLVPMFPPIGVVAVIAAVATVVCKIAESMGLKKEKEDEPEELAMKAEKDDKKPDDFDSTEEYIKHLQEDIKLSNQDMEKLNKMSPEERSAYRATGAYLYTKAINEKLGFDKTGLKNPELVGITAEVLADLDKLKSVLLPSEFVVYSKHLQSNGLGMKEFSDYLHNRSKDLSTDEKVQSAISDAMKEISPDISKEEIVKKLYDLNLEG